MRLERIGPEERRVVTKGGLHYYVIGWLSEMPIKCPAAPLEFIFLADWFFVYVIGDATNVPTSKAGSVAHYQADTVCSQPAP